MRVIHTGQALVDVVVGVPSLPASGGNVNATSYGRYAGGAVNILVAAARAGAEAVHAGAHGTGPNGNLIRADLAAEGVVLSAPPVPDEDTGICVVMVEPDAERTFVTTYAAERRITASSLATSAPEPGDLVCVTGYSLYPPTRDPLITWLGALDRRVRLVLDPGAAFADFDPPLRRRVLARTDVWTSNLSEAVSLLRAEGRTSEGRSGSAARGAAGRASLDMCDAALRVTGLLPPGAVAVVRDGPAGCAVALDGQVTEVPGFPREAVDTNGAGDCHTGVLTAEVSRGAGWTEAARRANAAAAIKVTRSGPATAPTRAEVDELLAADDAPAWDAGAPHA